MSDGSAFSMGFANAYKMMMDQEEKKKEQQAYKSYFDMQAQDAQAKIQPITDAATRAQFGANWADSNVAAANAPITTAPDKLADTRSLRFLSMTPEERTRAGITPEQSAQMDKSMQAEGPVNMQQANAGVAQTLAPIAQQADAAQTQAMLQQAQQRYGTEMFGKLGALVEKGFDPRMAMKIADNYTAKAEAEAQKQLQNQAYKNAMELMKQGKVDEAKMIIAEHLSPDAQGRMLASVGQGAEIQTTVQLANGNIGYMDKAGKVVDTGNKFYRAPEKPTNVITFSGQTFKDDNGREYQLDSRGQRHYAPNPAGSNEKMIDTPLGQITVSKFIDLHKQALGGDTISEHDDPYVPGKKIQSKTTRPSQPEILQWSKPLYDKLMGVQSPQGKPVDYGSSMNEVSKVLNYNATLGNGKQNRKQMEDSIKSRYGDLAPKIIEDTDWKAWGL